MLKYMLAKLSDESRQLLIKHGSIIGVIGIGINLAFAFVRRGTGVHRARIFQTSHEGLIWKTPEIAVKQLDGNASTLHFSLKGRDPATAQYLMKTCDQNMGKVVDIHWDLYARNLPWRGETPYYVTKIVERGV